MENSSTKTTKMQSAQQLSGQASTEDTNTQLLKQMSELMGCIKKITDSFEKQSKAVARLKTDFSNQERYNYSNRRYNYRGRGRGFRRGSYRVGYGRGYQNDNHQDQQTSNNRRGNGGGRFRGNYRGGANGRSAHKGNSSGGQASLLGKWRKLAQALSIAKVYLLNLNQIRLEN